jgi:LacI family transcriptional regulator, galactose operon repressor
MNDVATAAGVSLKTVSRVVNDEPGVTPLTEQRVREAIKTLGFRRNDSARLLRTGQAATVGLVMEDIGDPFYSTLLRGVENVARARGSLVLSGSSEADAGTEHELALAFCARRVDGLIMIPTSDDHSYLLSEMQAGVPVVFADRPPGQIAADTVLSDNVGGSREATAHLIAGGHRRIGYLGDDPGIFTARERHRGYLEAMTSAGVPVAEAWTAMGPPTKGRVGADLDRMLAGPQPVTALVCGNNRISVLALHALASLEVTLAMIGFDDFELADLLRVTVVAQDPAELGRQAADLLFRRMDGDCAPSRRIVIPTRLVQRGSGELSPFAP